MHLTALCGSCKNCVTTETVEKDMIVDLQVQLVFMAILKIIFGHAQADDLQTCILQTFLDEKLEGDNQLYCSRYYRLKQ